ncbi:hypothetical protein EGT07_20095 [Herbaspirillum sp. HC18]|nr:hypothetical protein EGT07_20095 [Herbaspirillum sp. HC18]
MKRLIAAILAVGWHAVIPAHAQSDMAAEMTFPVSDTGVPGTNAAVKLLLDGEQPPSALSVTSDPAAVPGDGLSQSREAPSGAGSMGFQIASRLLPSGSRLFGYARVSDQPALGTPWEPVEADTVGDTRDLTLAERWLDPSPSTSRVVGLGYARRGFKFEGLSYSRASDERRGVRSESLKIDSRSARLSYSPGANWAFQLMRGSASNLDYLVTGAEMRRTALAATYRHAFADSDWKTTVAWGRNARKTRKPMMGYLLESSLHFKNDHVIFGSLEQVGSDELLRENESIQRQLFKMNKLTAGYYQGVRVSNALALDVGVFVSRYFVPSADALSYGSNPTAYMMFVRVKLQ